MSLENDDNPAKEQKDLVFILAIAGRIDAQARNKAKSLYQRPIVHYLYAATDSLSSSYSMFKYFFDVCIGSTDPNALHNAMLSPVGIIAITLESVFLVGFSSWAVAYKDDKRAEYRRIADAWPYFRHIIKGLKNAYKGWRSATVALTLIGGLDIKFLVLPIGLTLGILAAANRVWMNSKTEARKTMMTNNGELLLAITKLTFLTESEHHAKLKEIKFQSEDERFLGYLSVAINGLIDSLYLYVGVLSIAALSPVFLMALTTVCGFYMLGCVVQRLYEEYDFQLKLVITQSQCRLALLSKRLESSYASLLPLKNNTNETAEDILKIKELEAKLLNMIKEFEKERGNLKALYSQSNLVVCLIGLKHGLNAYSALSSLLFFAGAMMLLMGVAFPPLLLLTTVFSGLGLIGGFLIHSFIVNSPNQENADKLCDESFNKILDMRDEIALTEGFVSMAEMGEFRQSLRSSLDVKPSKQFFYQECFETIRSYFSGLGKGKNFVQFAGNFLQEPDEQGHYHDTPTMYVLEVFSALLFAASLGLRAFARGFGRSPIGADAKLVDAVSVKIEITEPAKSIPKNNNISTTEKEELKGAPVKGKEGVRRVHSTNQNGFFNKEKVNFPHPRSELSLNTMQGAETTSPSIVQGLE